MKRSIQLLLILVLQVGLLGQVVQVNAQVGGTVIVSSPELNLFPSIRFHVNAYDSRGGFINRLQAGSLEIIEDGQIVQPSQVEQVDTGLQTIIALNTGPSLTTQVSGMPEYQRIQISLQNWAGARNATGLDDYSLATPTGLFLIRNEDPQQLEQALVDFQPDLVRLQPSLNSLAEALDLATDPLHDPLAKRSILYITPPLPGNNENSLSDLAKRARDINVQVNVWLMTPAAPADPSMPEPLQLMAEATGGKFFQVAPTDPLPEIEPLFEPLRHTYRVEYNSKIRTRGSHSLQVNVRQGATQLFSNQQWFDLNVQPPNPIFLDPPSTVLRSWKLTEEKSDGQHLDPEAIDLQILIEFPDQHPRPLTATRLYINDKLVIENTQEPFEQFTWDISDQSTPASLLVRVEATDSLGLSGASTEISVDILVDQPAQNSLINRFSERGIIAVSAILISGIALALVLVFTSAQRTRRWRRPTGRKQLNDPVSQPVNIRAAPARKENNRSIKERVSTGHVVSLWLRPQGQADPARLVILDENDQPVTGGVISLSGQEITFGSDPQRATQVLNSPTVDCLHARLFRSPEGEFILADQDSVAGTWINYAPVTSSGAHLEHGDLIHIGKVIFRFEVTDPERIPTVQARVTDLDSTL